MEFDITAITARFRKGSMGVGKSPRVVVDTLDLPPHTVTYHKPEDAFTHPNPTTMMKALRWILSRVEEVSSPARKVNLLEMYCGCGAHTVPIAKCAGEAVDKVLCVEVRGAKGKGWTRVGARSEATSASLNIDTVLINQLLLVRGAKRRYFRASREAVS